MTSNQIILALGGTRSGKSGFAERCAMQFDNVIYFATARFNAKDREMQERIAKHVARRPQNWLTLDPPASLDDLCKNAAARKADAVLIDCATLWLAWEFAQAFSKYDKHQLLFHMESEIKTLRQQIRQLPCPVFVVSNEVGSGVVPEHESGRMFRDLQGSLNCQLAEDATMVCQVIAGQSLLLKHNTHGHSKNSPVSEGYFPIASVSERWVFKQITQ